MSTSYSSLEELSINIFADGPQLNEIQTLKGIKGYTFNPTLFKKLNVVDYLNHCKDILNICGDLPVSLEVFADDFEGMIKQARILSELSENVYVKIPITFTNSQSTLSVIKKLTEEDIKLNITAVFTINQVKYVLPILKESNAIISVFAGRIFDIGIDAVKITKEISEYVHKFSNCKILWASSRMVYDIINASKSNCDIITMQRSLINKLSLFKKTTEEYSLETVKMFYEDAKSSGYRM
jgi:transaldolase